MDLDSSSFFETTVTFVGPRIRGGGGFEVGLIVGLFGGLEGGMVDGVLDGMLAVTTFGALVLLFRLPAREERAALVGASGIVSALSFSFGRASE